MSSPKVKLAFQGGGAKLIPMLAVAEAFRKAANHGLIEIDEVSGTSAGSICAALLATNSDFKTVRENIKSNGPDLLKSLIPEQIEQLRLKTRQKKKFKCWHILKYRHLLEEVLFNGGPVLSEEPLRRFVKSLFSASQTSEPIQIESLSPRLTIVCSNVANSIGENIKSGELVSAIIDSCALPILLRSFDALSGNHKVDGGLCDNLPIEALSEDKSIPIFAIYPAPSSEFKKINNLVTYISSLFSASINHNARRSQSMIAKPFRFEIDTEIGMLDFDKAMSLIEEAEQFDAIREKYYRRIENFSRSFGLKSSPMQSRVADTFSTADYQDCLANITKSYANLIEFKHAKFIARVNCKKKVTTKTKDFERFPDSVRRITQFRSKIPSLNYYLATIPLNNESIIPLVWSARNLTKNTNIPIRALPLNSRIDTSIASRHCLIEFLNSAHNICEDDLIEVEGAYHTPEDSDLSALNAGKSDYLGISNSQGGAIPIAELILIYPESIGRLKMVPNEDKSDFRADDFQNIELANGNKHLLEPGFTAIGMRVENFGSSKRFYVDINFSNN